MSLFFVFSLVLLYVGIAILLIDPSHCQTDTISLLKRYPNSFVTRSGSTLNLEGHPVRFAGGNIYWLGLDENGSPGIAYPTQFRVQDAIKTATQVLGATMIRAHTFGVSTGNSESYESGLNRFTSTGIDHIDYGIYQARLNNVRLVIPLTDNWNYYHGGRYTFTEWRGIPDSQVNQFYTNAQVVSDFKSYIAHLLLHVNNYTGLALKDDPTIMAWETGNELQPSPASWTNDICMYIKNITSEQLVLDGREGINDQELGYDCVDIYSDHYYPMSTSKVQSDSQKVKNANKAFIAGEFGWNDGGSPLQQFLDQILDGPTNMDAYWSLFPHNDSYGYEYHDDGFSLYYPGQDSGTQSKVVALREHAYKMAGVTNIPAYPICGEPMITAVACAGNNCHNSGRTVYWRGGFGCSGYDIQRNDASSAANDPNWKDLTYSANDFTGYFKDNDQIANSVSVTYYRIRGNNWDNKYNDYQGYTLHL